MDTKTPLDYFEDLLESNKMEIKKREFLSSFKGYNWYRIIDKEKAIVKYEMPEFDFEQQKQIGVTYEIASFEESFPNRVASESKKTQEDIKATVNSILNKGANPELFVKVQYQNLNRLISKAKTIYPNRSYIKKSLLDIQQYLREFYDLGKQELHNTQEIFPFTFLCSNPNEQQEKIIQLYNALHPTFIDSTRENFINAFTGQPITEPIKWLPISRRNKKPSKTSLLYFLDQLIDKNHLSSSIIHDLYKHIRYVFVDVNGNGFKNLKQTRQNMSENPDFKSDIDPIISSLV